jgi:hypothetical protein
MLVPNLLIQRCRRRWLKLVLSFVLGNLAGLGLIKHFCGALACVSKKRVGSTEILQHYCWQFLDFRLSILEIAKSYTLLGGKF